MVFTKEFILEKVKNNDVKFFNSVIIEADTFYKDGQEYTYEQWFSEVEEVYYKSYGDGNELYYAYHFPQIDIYVLITGTYSSWDRNQYDKVELAEPYEFKETRYRAIKR